MSVMSSPQGRAFHFSRKPPPSRPSGGSSSPPRKPAAYIPRREHPVETDSNLALDTLSGPEVRREELAPETIPGKLPIHRARKRLLRALEKSDVVIVTAETGAGKSTQVPQYLLDEGYSVTLTQPRRLAASAVSSRIAEEREVMLGSEVGFRHSLQNRVSRDSRLIVTTDGYELHRMLNNPERNSDVLIIDEFHERRESMDALLALWEKRQAEYEAGRGPKPPKLIIMSATLKSDELSERFGAPVVKARGRNYPIELRRAGDSILDDAIHMAELGKNTLVFLPGKGEIRQLEEKLRNEGVDAEIIPLHSQLTAEEQELAFRKYERPKIILATNIAETSITIDDIDAVIDSGMERRSELIDGVESLVIGPISRFNVEQRKGRCGRTGPGIYIYHGEKAIKDLEPTPAPEITRVPLERLVLTLKAAGEEIETLDFLDKPPEAHVKEAYSNLYKLNLLGPRKHVTNEGERVAELPVDVRTGKMLVRAADMERKVPGVLKAAIDLAAIIESEGITIHEKRRKWIRFTDNETKSDHIAQLKVFRAAQELDDLLLEVKGVDKTSFRRAMELRYMLDRRMGVTDRAMPGEPEPYNESIREALLESVWTGHMDSLFRHTGDAGRTSFWKGVQGRGERELARSSVVRDAELIIGKPFDIVMLGEHAEPKTIPLVLMATAVDPAWLMKHAPGQLKRGIKGFVDKAKRSIRNRGRGTPRHNGPRRVR
ncbi:MAG: ATP-dependent RNA helicase [Candidatus Dadabacteria bacterium]|nr:MAG: ATP-dependent RNA helicase [Candidatus Dadabacteria bacterium]